MLGFTDLFNLRQVQQTRNVGRNVIRINPGRLRIMQCYFLHVHMYLSIADSPAGQLETEIFISNRNYNFFKRVFKIRSQSLYYIILLRFKNSIIKIFKKCKIVKKWYSLKFSLKESVLNFSENLQVNFVEMLARRARCHDWISRYSRR